MIGNINSNYYSSLYGLNSLNRTSTYTQMYEALSSRNSSSLYGLNSLGSVNYGAVNSISGLKSDAKELQGAISKLQSGAAFNEKTAISSNTEAMTVSAKSSTRLNLPETSVGIEQLAAGQKNTGAALKASDRAAAGDYQVRIEAGGKTHTVSFKVNEGDTNEDMQKKFAAAVNDADIGISASVSTRFGMSTLTVQSTNTGAEEGKFAILDYVGNAVQQMGVGSATEEAQDAVYTVNGKQHTSAKNEVNLGNGVTATLKKATEEDVKVTAGYNESAAVDAAKEFVNSFNDLIKSEDGNSRLGRELSAVTKAYSSSLGRLGITSQSDGTLAVDDDKLAAAAQSGSLRSFFTQDRGRSYGFTNQVDRVAGNVGRSPLNYVNSFSEDSRLFQSSSSLYGSLLNNNQMNMMGMFFNFMI